MRSRQRGFGTLLIYGLLALAILGAIAGLVAWVDRTWATTAGKKWGAAEVQGRWDKANREAEAKEKADAAARQAAAEAAAAALHKAEEAAKTYEFRWKEVRRAQNRLAVCPEGPAMPRSPGEGTAPSIRLTWGFLRLYDAAWTDAKGEPVFGDPGRPSPAGQEAEAPSPLGLGELLDTNRDNAEGCSANARQLDALTALIRRLREDWKP